ncbi:MAG: TldD/PmbA family protein [Arenibacterium sp.]
MNQLQQLGGALIERALARGADAADAVVASGSSISIDVARGALEHAERAEGIDLGLRVMLGQRQAIVSASDSSDSTLDEMAERAIAMAREAPEDPFAGLASPDLLAHDFDVTALELADPSAEPSPIALEEDARIAEAAALGIDGVSQVQSATAGYGAQETYLCTSNGFGAGYHRTSRSISAVAIAGEGTGMERDYDGESRIFQSDLRAPDDVGRLAGERAVARLNPRKPATGTYPVLFDERIASSLVGHLLMAVNGASVARGSSWLKDALGEEVLPDALSLVEDPHRPRMAASRPFDAEGLPTARRVIVDNGVLTGWTLDLASARKLGMHSTANAARGASSLPSPSNWNIELTQGAQSPKELMRDMGEGLLITSMIGSTINPNTGDYSRGAAGFWIENGEVAYAVNECTIAGNLRDMLRRIIPANDARTDLSRVVPSLMIEGMTIAGN